MMLSENLKFISRNCKSYQEYLLMLSRLSKIQITNVHNQMSIHLNLQLIVENINPEIAFLATFISSFSIQVILIQEETLHRELLFVFL